LDQAGITSGGYAADSTATSARAVVAENGTAAGFGSKATGGNATAVGQSAEATGKNSTAIGQGAKATADNSVALGQGSVADEDNTVSVGRSSSNPNEVINRRITNVAPGVKGTDAVNVNQLNEVKRDLRKTDKKLRGGIAGATAVANIPQVTVAGSNMVGVGVGNYKGQSAVAVGYSRASDSNRVIFKASAAATTQGDYNVGAGIGYQW